MAEANPKLHFPVKTMNYRDAVPWPGVQPAFVRALSRRDVRDYSTVSRLFLGSSGQIASYRLRRMNKLNACVKCTLDVLGVHGHI